MAVIFCYQRGDSVDSAGTIRVELGVNTNVLLVRRHLLVVGIRHGNGGNNRSVSDEQRYSVEIVQP